MRDLYYRIVELFLSIVEFIPIVFKEFMNDYGVYTPYVVMFILYLFLSRAKFKGFLFKRPSELEFPPWLTNNIRKHHKRNGLFNIVFGIIFYISYCASNIDLFLYIGTIAFGIGSSFVSFEFVHIFFPTSRIKLKEEGLLKINDKLIIAMIAFYMFITYTQLIWPNYEDDPDPNKIEGLKRIYFFFTGMSFWNILIPLVIMTIGRHKLSIISVVLLLFFALFMVYIFVTELLVIDNLRYEPFVFSFIIPFVITTFFLENFTIFVNTDNDVY